MKKISRRQALLTGAALGPALVACESDHAHFHRGGRRVDGPPPAERIPAAPRVGDAGSAGPDTRPFSAPGRVVEVRHADAVSNGVVDANVVRGIVQRGMLELTGEATETAAWRAFFEPDDVVVVKVNPFGWPKFFSQLATVAEIVRGLGLAGVSNDRIVIYDRYTDYLDQVGYQTYLPAGIRFASVATTTDAQTSLDGHDPDVFVEFDRVDRGLDATLAQNRRSHLSKIVSQEATKVVNVPVLKSHWTAGFTAALKNMTYGLVNNTARTHGESNWTVDFLPAVAAMKALREKVVLNVVDMLVACYANGPEPSNETFEHASLAFSTDPVAIDRICWNILDAARVERGHPPVADMEGTEPEYVLRCGEAGLGVADLARIDHRKVDLST